MGLDMKTLLTSLLFASFLAAAPPADQLKLPMKAKIAKHKKYGAAHLIGRAGKNTGKFAWKVLW